LQRYRWTAYLTLIAVLLAACATPPPTGNSFSILASPATFTTLADETLQITVTISGSPGGAVILDIADLAPDMSVPTTITLPDGTASGQLSLVVGPDVALGDATVTVTAVGPDASATADIEITVDPTPGSIDSSYGDAGQAVFPKSMGGGDIRDIAVDADGNAVVVFSYSNGDNNDFGVARMLPDGTLDPTFGTDGWTFADGGDDSGDSPRSVAIDGDGTILVGGNGRVAASTDTDLLVMRFESDGTLDAAFGTGGVAAIDSGSSESGGAIAIDGDGNIAIVGNFGCCGSGDVVVGRFDSGGTPDATFDGDGVLTFDLGGGDEDRADGVTIDGSDRIVIVGSGRSASSTSHDAFVARFADNGSFDGGFNGGKPLFIDIDDGRNELFDVAIDADGAIVAVGYTGFGGGVNEDALAVRITPAGALDPTFDSDGIVTVDVTGAYDFLEALALAPDGDIVAVGTSIGGPLFQELTVVRLDPDGGLDSDFNKDGIFLASGGFASYAGSLAIDQDGSYLIGGVSIGPLLLKIDPTP
jgi:uncharacterized delta-60 repeat protein